MPEGNKKDSFTFSDKIKSSKPALTPFSRRVSSKIGNNGKPKKTIFERTKRDAPFFVAALLALLLLPFLYKYSGNVQEEPIVPISEGSSFDPERYGFDHMSGDPDSQIAQLAGRDPLSLIKGWGSAPEMTPGQDAPYRDGLEGGAYTPPASTGNTNIYRNEAPAATRAAFQRSATKIKELGSASMAGGRGGGIVGRWGGSLKNAAARNNNPRAAYPTKPVSLQPLTAAGKPSRSYFGQGGAAEARRSKNALSKGNAMQALMDAQMRAVDPTQLGGFGSGALGGGSGGDMKRDFAYKGITPWWWDLLKDRAQQEWQLWFDQKKKLVNTFGDFLQNALMCLLTGQDDNSMGTMFGAKKGSGNEDKCCGLTKEQWEANPERKGIPFNKKQCQATKCENYKYKDGSPWEGGNVATGNLNFLAVRLDCLSNGLLGDGGEKSQNAGLDDYYNCENIDTTHNFSLVVSGKALKWKNIYHAMVVKNYRPFDKGPYLCGTSLVNANKASGTGVAYRSGGKGMQNAQEEYAQARKGAGNSALKNTVLLGTQKDKVATAQASQKEALGKVNAVTGGSQVGSRINAGGDELDTDILPDETADACVVYVAQGKILQWENFKAQTKILLAGLYDIYGKNAAKPDMSKEAAVEEAFNNMPFFFIEGFAFDSPMAKGSVELTNAAQSTINNAPTVIVKGMPLERLPLKYADFEEYFVRRSGNTAYQSTDFKDKERDFRTSSKKNNAARTMCIYNKFKIVATPVEDGGKPQAVLNFDPSMKVADFTVRATLKDDNGKVLAQSAALAPKGASSSKDGQDHQPYEWTDFDQSKISKDQYSSGQVYWTAVHGNRNSADNTPVAAVPVVKEDNPPAVAAVMPKGFTIPMGPTMNNCGKPTMYVENGPYVERTAPLREGFADILLFCGADNDCRKFVQEQNAKWLDTPEARELAKKANPNADDATIDKVLSDVKTQHLAYLTTLDKNQGGFTLADFANAVDYALSNNNGAQISKNIACRVARQVVSISADPEIKDNNGQTGTVNMFGTMAVYIGADSSYFPSLYYKPTGSDTATDDMRFRGCCTNRDKQGRVAPGHHWGSYNTRGDNARYVAGLNGNFPLAPLSVNWTVNTAKTAKADDTNRNAYHKAYQFAFSGDCNYNNAPMNVAAVQKYIQSVCDNGLQYKPVHGKYTQCPKNCNDSLTNVGVGENIVNKTRENKNK